MAASVRNSLLKAEEATLTFLVGYINVLSDRAISVNQMRTQFHFLNDREFNLDKFYSSSRGEANHFPNPCCPPPSRSISSDYKLTVGLFGASGCSARPPNARQDCKTSACQKQRPLRAFVPLTSASASRVHLLLVGKARVERRAPPRKVPAEESGSSSEERASRPSGLGPGSPSRSGRTNGRANCRSHRLTPEKAQ